MTDNKFTWVPFFKEVHEKIHNNYNAEQLANIANEIFGHIKDIDDQGNEVSIQEMTPINFIGYFNRRLTLNNRVLYCKKLREIMNLNSDIPTDFDGIPEFNNQNCLCMPFKKDRVNYIIQEQWEISKQILENNIKTELFDKILSNAHPWIGLSYLSRFCFIVKPEKYYPYDKQMAINLNAKMPETFKGYEDYCKLLKYTYPEKTSYELSYEAFMENNNKQNKKQLTSQKKYWIYQPGEQGRLWNEVYANNIIAIGWEELGDLKQYNSEEDLSEKITEIYSKKSNPDKLANWEFANVMNIGDIVYVKKGSKDLIGRGIVQSDYYFDDTRSEYKSLRKIQWTHNGNYNVDFNELGIKQWVQKTLTNISENKYKDFCLKIEDIFMKNNQAQQNDEIPLNQILYGPPGTGKTFRTKEIVKNILSKNTIEKAENTIKDVDASTPWWQAIALAMYKKDPHKSYKVAEIEDLIEDYVKLKNNKTVRNKIWEQLQKHTDFNSETVFATDRNKPFLFDKNMPDSTWNLTKQGISYIEDQLINTVITEQQDTETNKYFDFVTFHQSYSYEEFVEGIKPSTENGQIKYDNTNGIFKKMCIKANSDPTNNYILVIDEINRGNISKIFGELITLIEEDKRIIPNGANDADDKNLEIDEQSKDNNSIVVKLPYSQKLFGVPKNLYIVGTMNTSDRSIASIDIALRRRFVFKEIMPDVNLIPNIDVFGINLQKIFTTLNERISVLLDRDHQIGHSYFMKLKDSSDYNSDFKRVWYDCVMPLLNEYFYGDWEKLCALLGDSQDEGKSFIKKLNNVKFANNYSCDEDETYDIVSESSINFEAAIKNAFKNI